jgi:hypothetical protein
MAPLYALRPMTAKWRINQRDTFVIIVTKTVKSNIIFWDTQLRASRFPIMSL